MKSIVKYLFIFQLTAVPAIIISLYFKDNLNPIVYYTVQSYILLIMFLTIINHFLQLRNSKDNHLDN
jgi:hypothetical protein